MRIVAAGCSGFIGTALLARLRAPGHDVIQLVRRPAGGSDEVRWRPETGEFDPSVLSGADVVINLAGVGVGDKRWTPQYRDLIRSSRVGATSTLARAIAAAPTRPAVMLNASAVGFYGNTGQTPVGEDAPPGEGYFPQVCQAWEAATTPASDAGVRVVRMRSGIVLGPDGGSLARFVRLFRLGLGGKLAGGRWYLSWISLADELSAMEFLLSAAEVAGPVNLTGPAPVTNAEFTAALSAAVNRPALLPVPQFALRIGLGEFAREVTASLRVMPERLTRAGFQFEHPDVRSALAWALGRRG